MEELISRLEIEARGRYVSFGEPTRHRFRNIVNASPTSPVLVSYFSFCLRWADLANECEAVHADHDPCECAFELITKELFDACSHHLNACLICLEKEVQKKLERYKTVTATDPTIYNTEGNPAPMVVEEEIGNNLSKSRTLASIQFDQIENTTEAWATHFDKYDRIIESYQKLIEQLKPVLATEDKKNNEEKGIKLRYVALGVAVLGILISSYFALYK